MSNIVTTKVQNKRDEFIDLLVIATAMFDERFYVGRETAWGKVTDDVAKNAEAQYNDPESGVYSDFRFAATIKALTDEDIKLRTPHTVTYQVGVVVVPVEPAYGKRRDDGYTVGKAYLCTNESSGGKFRNADNIGARMTPGSSNAVQVMSTVSDEVRPATEEEIIALADEMLAVKGLSLMTDLLDDLQRRYGHML